MRLFDTNMKVFMILRRVTSLDSIPFISMGLHFYVLQTSTTEQLICTFETTESSQISPETESDVTARYSYHNRAYFGTITNMSRLFGDGQAGAATIGRVGGYFRRKGRENLVQGIESQ